MLQLFIKTLTGETLEIKVSPNDSIKKIKEEIDKKKNILPRNQKLMFNGKELNENGTIEEYNIENNSTIHLIIRLTSLEIFVKDSNERTITLVVDLDDTIEKVKKLYYEKTQEQITILLFNGVQLNDEMKVKDYGIQNGSNLQTSKRLKGGKIKKK